MQVLSPEVGVEMALSTASFWKLDISYFRTAKRMLRVIFLKFTFFRFKDFSKTFANSFDNCGLSSSGRALNKRNIGCV